MAKTKKTKTKVGISKPAVVKAAVPQNKKSPGKPPDKPIKPVRIFIDCANQHRSYMVGRSYKVPEEVPMDTARSWLKSGAAEEDKSLAGAPEETK